MCSSTWIELVVSSTVLLKCSDNLRVYYIDDSPTSMNFFFILGYLFPMVSDLRNEERPYLDIAFLHHRKRATSNGPSETNLFHGKSSFS